MKALYATKIPVGNTIDGNLDVLRRPPSL